MLRQAEDPTMTKMATMLVGIAGGSGSQRMYEGVGGRKGVTVVSAGEKRRGHRPHVSFMTGIIVVHTYKALMM